MSEDPSTPAASGGLDTINPPKALDGAAVAMEAAGISRSLIDDGEGSVPHVDIATLPKTDSSRPLPKENATLLFTEHDDVGSLGVVGSMQKPAAVAKQEVDIDKKLSGPQDESVEAPFNETAAATESVDDLVKESTVAAWPGALMDAPELNDDESGDVNEVETPHDSDAAFSETPTTTLEYDKSSEMPATTTPSTTSPMETTTTENPTTTSELPPTTNPTTSTYTEVPTTTAPTSPSTSTMPATTTYPDKD